MKIENLDGGAEFQVITYFNPFWSKLLLCIPISLWKTNMKHHKTP